MSPTGRSFAPILAPICPPTSPKTACVARRGNREAVHHQRCARLLAEGSWQHGLTMHSASEWNTGDKKTAQYDRGGGYSIWEGRLGI